jgi:large subunit ribosomal protein L9
MAKTNEKKAAAKPKKKAAAASKAKGKEAAAKAVAVNEPPRQPGVERRKNHPTRAKGGHMEILLTQAVPFVGKPGELVKVKPGFARNYLLPHGMATFATPHNLRIVEKHRKRLQAIEEARRTDLMNLSAQIARTSIKIEANGNAEGYLYGSVNADLIASGLKARNLAVEANNIRIEGPLKEHGRYIIKVHLAPEIDTEFELWVVPPLEGVEGSV